ncbi:MAG: ImmA/IrrE family metallo-endopeptidase [Gammaproteobacteria bacterium]|nr:ImmA/IrrE family metallo-endopeptidase [Gammaproteobacteria bacterium]
MSDLQVRVAPTSRIKLRKVAMRVREVLGAKSDEFPSDAFDLLLSGNFPEYKFDILPRSIMGRHHGLTEPDQKIIFLREDVYEGAMEGNGRDRFTFAHELGHLLLHSGNYLARYDPAEPKPTHRKFEDSEWQADNFAAELLMPVSAVKSCADPNELMEVCEVSYKAAQVRFDVLRSGGFI